MADSAVRPLYRNGTSGKVQELADSDSLIVGQGIQPKFLDLAEFYKTAFFVPGDGGFTTQENQKC